MYEATNTTIRRGLSKGARLLLGSVAGLFGLLMLLMAGTSSSPAGFVAFGIFCLAIAIACATSGRVRQFFGSVVGSAIFGLAVWYLWSQAVGGPVTSDSRAEPSLLNAALFLVFLGLPGGSYAISAKFGFRR